MKLNQIILFAALLTVSLNALAMEMDYEETIQTYQAERFIRRIGMSPDNKYIGIEYFNITEFDEESEQVAYQIIRADNLEKIHPLAADNYNRILNSIKLEPVNLSEDTRQKIYSPNQHFYIKAHNYGSGYYDRRREEGKNRLTGYRTFQIEVCKNLKLLEGVDKKERKLVKYHHRCEGTIVSAAITPNNKFIITCHIIDNHDVSGMADTDIVKTGEIVLWNEKTGKRVSRLHNLFLGFRLPAIQKCIMNEDGNLLVVGYVDGMIHIVGISNKLQILHKFKSKNLGTKREIISSITISSDNQFIVIGYESGLIKKVEIDHLEKIQNFIEKTSENGGVS